MTTLNAREYQKYRADTTELPLNTLIPDKFFFKTYQKLVSNIISPHTNFQRIIVKFETGTGKTNTAIVSAQQYVDYMRNIGIESRAIVISFSKSVFVREMITRPELGFVTQRDLDHITDLRKNIKLGLSTEESLTTFIASLKKRVSSTFTFIGFREFANDILRSSGPEVPEDPHEIAKMIESGQLKLNLALLEKFENSFVIIDEFHKLYSSKDVNHYGASLRFMLELFAGNIKVSKYTPRSSIKAIFLSATPLSNKPTEAVDLLNIVVPGANFTKDNFFITGTTDFLPNALTKFRDLFANCVCYVKSSDMSAYPSREFVGTSIKGIPYLKFVTCPMSKAQEKLSKSYDKVPVDAYAVMDYAMPLPDGTYEVIYSKIVEAYRATPVSKPDGKHEIKSWFTDDYLHFTGLLPYLSTKDKELLNIISSTTGKTLVYHGQIRSSGVIFKGDLLHDDGHIEYGESPSENTRCAICNLTLSTHRNTELDHAFAASCYAIVHGELTKPEMLNILEMYNSPANTFGLVCRILIGSRVILESLNFTSIQHHLICSHPRGIGEILQNLGRSVRMNSSILLPPDLRHVKIYILISTYDGSTPSPEQKKYFNKMQEYLKIQQIDKIMHEVALDATLNSAINITKDDSLNALRTSVSPQGEVVIDDAQYYKYYINQEIDELITIIKAIFINFSKVWKASDLWDAVLDLGVNYEFSKATITYEAFVICLNMLVNGSEVPQLQKQSFIFDIDGAPHRIYSLSAEGSARHPDSDNDVYLIALQVPSEEPSNLGISTVPQSATFILDAWYRNAPSTIQENISITKYITSAKTDMNQLRILFLTEHIQSSPARILDSLHLYAADFHVYMLKYCIRYIFNVLTNPDINLTEFHNSILNVAHVYESLGYIIYASDLPKKYLPSYESYIALKGKHHDDSGFYRHMLESRLLAYTEKSIALDQIKAVIAESHRIPQSALDDLKFGKTPIIRPVHPSILPVGFSLATTSSYEFQLYVPDDWTRVYEPLYNMPADENDIIIGYEIDSPTIGRTFKLRKSVKNVPSNKRLVNRGMACTSFHKDQARAIAKQLGIKDPGARIKDICSLIRKELINRELKSRSGTSKSPKKWFYFSYEYNPLRH